MARKYSTDAPNAGRRKCGERPNSDSEESTQSHGLPSESDMQAVWLLLLYAPRYMT
jgi:hypothetical protein